jgi:hypothetical protein
MIRRYTADHFPDNCLRFGKTTHTYSLVLFIELKDRVQIVEV